MVSVDVGVAAHGMCMQDVWPVVPIQVEPQLANEPRFAALCLFRPTANGTKGPGHCDPSATFDFNSVQVSIVWKIVVRK